MYHDAPIRHPSPSSSVGSDDDHAVFCFCGEEIFPDEEGETSIYCSTVCARQDALQSLLASGATTSADASRLGTAASSTTSSSTSISGSYASSSSVLLPSSMINTSSYAPASSLSTKPVSLGPSLFSPGGSENDSYASSAHASDDNDDDEDTSGGGIVDWQASHYRRMERERAQLLERRRRAKEARRHEHQVAVAQFRLQQPVHQQRSSDDRISHNASLSRSNTTSSASSSSRCYISTHPSRARTPELAFHSSIYASSSHGRNDSLASSLSTRSSAASGWGVTAGGSGGWGGGFGLGLAGASPAVVTSSSGGEMMITEEDEDDGGGAVERIRLSASEKGKERERVDVKGMRMSDVLNEILAMEKGFVVPTSSPPRIEPTSDFLSTPAPEAGDAWMTGTPPRLAFYDGTDRSSSTPKGRSGFHQSSLSDSSFNLAALAAFPSSGAGQVPPSTPSRSASHGNGTSKLKRSLAITPPPLPPPAAPITRRRPSVSGPSHRRAPSNQYHHRRTHSAASASKKPRPTMSSPEMDLPMRRSVSPLPPPPDLPSRPRTLVYSSDHRPTSSSYRTSSSEGSLDHYSGSASPPRPFLARKAWAGGAAGFPGSESVWSFPSLGSESSLATVQQTQQHPYALAYRLREATTGNTEQGSIPFPLFNDDDSSPTLPHLVPFDSGSAAAGPLAPPVALVSPSAGVSAVKTTWGGVIESEVVGNIKLEAATNEQALWTGWPAAETEMGDGVRSWEVRRR